MGICQISDVYVITDASTVISGIICSKYLYIFSFTCSSVQYEGYEMGFRVVPFSNLAFWICTCRIEVSERNILEAIGRTIILLKSVPP